jgi:DNA-binding Xre family transcriptional regulator
MQTLSREERESFDTAVNLLKEKGPMLGRPYVDTVKGSAFSNMKELRTAHDKHLALRAFFAFDPKRAAILLIGPCIRQARKDTMANKTLSYDSIADELMTKASRVRAKKRANAILKRMTLDELRKERKMTQGKLALAMKIEQSEVSRLEKRSEVKLGTLRNYVSALGGHIEIRAVFPDKDVELALSE